MCGWDTSGETAGSLPLWRKIRAGGKDLTGMHVRNHRGGMGSFVCSSGHSRLQGTEQTLESGCNEQGHFT